MQLINNALMFSGLVFHVFSILFQLSFGLRLSLSCAHANTIDEHSYLWKPFVSLCIVASPDFLLQKSSSDAHNSHICANNIKNIAIVVDYISRFRTLYLALYVKHTIKLKSSQNRDAHTNFVWCSTDSVVRWHEKYKHIFEVFSWCALRLNSWRHAHRLKDEMNLKKKTENQP